MNQGSSNRMIYDNCSYAQWEYTSTEPFQYQMYMGRNENVNKCRKDKFWHPYDLVDVESELRNQTRPNSKCGINKYNPNCSMSSTCMSTVDPKVPVILAPECCSILHQNIPRRTDPGYRMPEVRICDAEERKPFSPN